jgi:hypothetical protein
MAKFATAELGVPCALGLVEDDYMLMGWIASRPMLAQESDERLDRGLDLLPRCANALALIPCIARQRFTHHMHERQVAGQERRAALRAEHGV